MIQSGGVLKALLSISYLAVAIKYKARTYQHKTFLLHENV